MVKPPCQIIEFRATDAKGRLLTRHDKNGEYRTPYWLRVRILRDHKFVEDVNRTLHGDRRLLELTSTAIFDHHHQGQLFNPRQQRNTWKDAGDLVASDEGFYCPGCCWKVAEDLHPFLDDFLPTIPFMIAEHFINLGRRSARRPQKRLC